jgi:hypothetical protein
LLWSELEISSISYVVTVELDDMISIYTFE